MVVLLKNAKEQGSGYCGHRFPTVSVFGVSLVLPPITMGCCSVKLIMLSYTIICKKNLTSCTDSIKG